LIQLSQVQQVGAPVQANLVEAAGTEKTPRVFAGTHDLPLSLVNNMDALWLEVLPALKWRSRSPQLNA
jgi:hypothetical protein